MSTVALCTEVDEMQFLPFPSVAALWLESRRLHLSAETQRNYGQYIKSLSAFFGDARLNAISGDRIRAYQRARATNASNGFVNKINSGDVKNVGSELLAEFRRALTAEIFQKGYRLGDVLCEGSGAEAFNEALKREEKSPLHMICVGYALAQEGKKTAEKPQICTTQS